MRHAAHLTLLLLLTAAGCGGSSTGPSNNNNNNPPQNNPPQNNPPTTTNAISVTNNYFDPLTTTVPVNTKVTWTWNTCGSDGYGGQTCVAHDILFDDATTSGSQQSGTWSRTFTAAGTYKYHCSIHGSYMSGTIVVQ
ncbi:MAG TPA: cupredoxin domain-containing protein [Gemmatimonadaceae bacterium]|nr:cupredoxin domain-containing protein [Gemmatimonadaceae bacterium]